MLPASTFSARLPRKLRKLLYRNYRQRDCYKCYDRLGLKLLLNYANYVDRQLIIHEPYETAQLQQFLDTAEQNIQDLFLDVGANLGLYALLAARSNNFREVMAFEPDPRNYRQLITNIAFSNMTNAISAYACGLSDRDTELDFLQAHRRSTGQSRVRMSAPAGTAHDRYTNTCIPVIRFDDHFSYRDCQVMIKIDVEGHEITVVNGMQQLLSDNDCHLQVEVFETNIQSLESLLATLGYRHQASFGHDRLYRKS